MEKESFKNSEEDDVGFLRSTMLYGLYKEFRQLHPDMDDMESFVSFFVNSSFEELNAIIDAELESLRKTIFEMIKINIATKGLLNGDLD